jgi:peptide/nickel transport system substrate-binding protein
MRSLGPALGAVVVLSVLAIIAVIAARATGVRPLLSGLLGDERAAVFAQSALSEEHRPQDASVVTSIHSCERGGTIVAGSIAEPKSFNPLMASETNTTEVTHRIFDNLVELDCERLEYLPGLAKSWDVSPDGRRWTFALRRGVEWADGVPFTADDVLFTFRVIYDPATDSPERDGVMLDGEPFAVSAPDPHTIVIETAKPFGPMLHALATSAAIVPRHVWERALEEGRFASAMGIDTPPEQVFGTGPFRLEKREPGRTALVRNDRYWKFDSAGTRLPYAERIVFVVADQNTWRLKFEEGEVDGYSVRADEVSDMVAASGRGGFDVFEVGPRMGTLHLWFNQNAGADARGVPFVEPRKLAWFRDLRFRKAVSHAIDRDAIVSTVYGGRGVSIYGPISPGDLRWYNPDIPKYGYDPERARALLAEIGFRDRDGDGFLEDAGGAPVAFTLLTNSNNTLRIQIGRLVESDLAAVGIRAKLDVIEPNALMTMIQEAYAYDACLSSSASSGDPSSAMNWWLSSGSSHHFNPKQKTPATAWEREADSLATAHLMTADYAERKRLFDRVQELFAENLGFIYLANDNIHYAVRKRFVNVRPGRVRAFNEFLWNEDEIGVAKAP